MNTTRWRRLLPALLTFVLACGGMLSVTSLASALIDGRYVSLGDSYTAGPLVGPPTTEDVPLGCVQSINNYPHLVRPLTQLRHFTDVSCSGAQTKDMTRAQGVTPGPAKPQFDALTSDTLLVSLTIGGNDVGFSSIAQDCIALVPFGSPCRNKFVVGGVDTLAQRMIDNGPKVGAVIRGIKERSPRAKVFILGYPAILPETGKSCWPVLPITSTDVKYLLTVQKNLNAMIKTQANANGAIYVDTYTPSIGHDACQGPTTRWVESVVPTLPGFSIHPNSIGAAAMAQILWQSIRASRWGV